MEIRVQEFPACRIAFLRHVGPYIECGATWQRLMQMPEIQGELGAGAKSIGICHDDPHTTPAAECRYDACVTVGPEFEPSGDLQIRDFEGGRFAMATHRGTYANLGHTYGAVAEWINENGEQRAAPCFEIYVNDCNQVPEEDLITEVYLPVA